MAAQHEPPRDQVQRSSDWLRESARTVTDDYLGLRRDGLDPAAAYMLALWKDAMRRGVVKVGGPQDGA